MKLKSTCVAAAAYLVCALAVSHATTIITYEDIDLGSQGYINNVTYSSSGVTHTNSFNATWGSWSGFAISNNTNTTLSSFVQNEYISHSSGAASGSQFAVGYVSSSTSTRLVFGAPTDMTGFGAMFTNTRAAANSMLNGDAFAKKFGGTSGNDQDWFLLSIQGYKGGSATGSTELYLADFRFADNTMDFILQTWTNLDFTPLGTVDEIRFSLSSSDVGDFGMNTPAYFAMDQLVVPEASTSMLGMATVLVLLGRRARRKI
jgi:hypothetical protein